MTYAQIENGVVINTLMVGEEDVAGLDPAFTWVDISGLDPQPFVGCSYDGVAFGGMVVARSLDQLKAKKLMEFNAALEAYVMNAYDQKTQFRFFVLYYMAQQNSMPNRAAYIQPLFDWSMGVIAYSSTVLADVMSKATDDEVNSYAWDFGLIDPAAPTLTLIGAISILN